MPNWRTAITRRIASRPARILCERGLLNVPRKLDYGCGRSLDAKWFLMDRYDPHFYPELPQDKYDVILCSYVLCVVTEEEQTEIINTIKNLLKPNGKAYFTVRRDLKEQIDYDDYSQRIVYLPFNSIYKHRDFEIYEYENIHINR